MARRGEKQADTGTTTGTTSATNDPTGASGQTGGGTAVQRREGRRRGLAPALAGTGAMRGIPPSPWELMGRMGEELTQLFESIGGTGMPGTARGQAVAGQGTRGRGAGQGGAVGDVLLIPQIEVEQRDDAIVVRADLPGMNADEIDVTIDDGMLVISGERRDVRREEREGVVRSEVSYGTFYRTIPLPDGADENNIAAVVRNGVLEVVVPVSEAQAGRRVQVRSEDAGTGDGGTSGTSGTSGAGGAGSAGSRGGRGDGHG
jgi:HSP20 family protein